MFTFYQFTSIQSRQNFADPDACLPLTCLLQSKVPKFSGPPFQVYLLLSEISELKKLTWNENFLDDAGLPFISLPLCKAQKIFLSLSHYLFTHKQSQKNFRLMFSYTPSPPAH